MRIFDSSDLSGTWIFRRIMPSNTLLKHFFGHGAELDPDDRFNLNRKSRSRRLREITKNARKHHILKGFTPSEFRALLEDLGPSFVKIGQTLSTRSEILPKAYCDELAKLQTECDPLPFDEVIDALRDIYGERFDEVFESIDPKPLGSASLAQVHKALLRNGDVVAVKVQRPGVQATMAQDIDIMRVLVGRVSRVLPEDQVLNLSEVVEEMWKTFLEETDFECEAENLRLFKQLNNRVAFIDCPKVYPELCSEHCLVMEYIEGIPIYDHDALVAAGYDLPEIGEKMLDNYATQILEHGFFHADPHPGNIIVREGKIVYIDLGMTGRLTPIERAGFGDIVMAVGMQDAGKLKDALMSFAESKDIASIDHARFLADLDSLLGKYASCDVADLDIGQMLADVMVLTRMSKVTLPSTVTNVSKGIVTIEGTIADFIANDSILSIINAHIARSGNPIDRAEESLRNTAIDARRAADGAVQAAAYSGETLRMLTRGQLKFNMEMLGSAELMASISKIVNRLTIAIVIAGLFIGSSMYARATGEGPFLGVGFIPFFGFVGAFLLSVWMMFDIWRRK